MLFSRTRLYEERIKSCRNKNIEKYQMLRSATGIFMQDMNIDPEGLKNNAKLTEWGVEK
jgi:hypothetical protein